MPKNLTDKFEKKQEKKNRKLYKKTGGYYRLFYITALTQFANYFFGFNLSDRLSLGVSVHLPVSTTF